MSHNIQSQQQYGMVLVLLLSLLCSRINIYIIMEMTTKKLLTKYFYKDNQLCFQILITIDDKKDIIGEYSNYSDYRKAFVNFLSKMEAGNVIDINIYGEQNILSEAA